MLLNAGRLYASLSLVLIFVLGAFAQTTAPQTTAAAPVVPPIGQPVNAQLAVTLSAADVMRARVAKAKAFVATKNYAAAIYELEGIKRESNDPAISGATQVMLISCYLEQMDYKRAQNFLNEIYTSQKANKPNVNYFAIAGQVVKSARNQLERYKSLGLNVSDRNLPVEAVTDVDRMRETLELVVTQSKTLGTDKKQSSDAMALLEEASGARTALARDEYDAKRWKEELADARDSLMNSRTTVINAVQDTVPVATPNNTVAANMGAANAVPTITKTETAPQTNPAVLNNAPSNQPVQTPANAQNPNTASEQTAKNNDLAKTTVIEVPKETSKETAQPKVERQRVAEDKTAVLTPNVAQNNETKAAVTPAVETAKNTSPLQVGSLVEYATEKTSPVYPPAARMMRKTGVVKVEVTVNEEGKIETVQNTSGESLLQRAAVDALKKWKFKPFVRDGQPVKATGFVNFNFNL